MKDQWMMEIKNNIFYSSFIFCFKRCELTDAYVNTHTGNTSLFCQAYKKCISQGQMREVIRCINTFFAHHINKSRIFFSLQSHRKWDNIKKMLRVKICDLNGKIRKSRECFVPQRLSEVAAEAVTSEEGGKT